jgi:hypothetical protein
MKIHEVNHVPLATCGYALHLFMRLWKVNTGLREQLSILKPRHTLSQNDIVEQIYFWSISGAISMFDDENSAW